MKPSPFDVVQEEIYANGTAISPINLHVSLFSPTKLILLIRGRNEHSRQELRPAIYGQVVEISFPEPQAAGGDGFLDQRLFGPAFQKARASAGVTSFTRITSV